MKTIEVGGVIFRVLYAGVSPFTDVFKAQIYHDGLGIIQIAGALDGNKWIAYTAEGETEIFRGYSKLTGIKYADAETVLVFLEREVNNNV